VGLIARQIEAAGIPTLCMTSALSITRSVDPPRAAFLDYPLGHTTGKPHARALQQSILRDALAGFVSIDEPGGIRMLDYTWSEDDDWKDSVMRPRVAPATGAGVLDERTTRHPTPQYQCDADRELAERALATDGCPSCVFLEESAKDLRVR
jgi:hypothetical protein